MWFSDVSSVMTYFQNFTDVILNVSCHSDVFLKTISFSQYIFKHVCRFDKFPGYKFVLPLRVFSTLPHLTPNHRSNPQRACLAFFSYPQQAHSISHHCISLIQGTNFGYLVFNYLLPQVSEDWRYSHPPVKDI